MRVRFQLLLIAALTLGAYYPSIFAPLSAIDDAETVQHVAGAGATWLKDLFLPGGGRLYYRPLLGLSLYFDRFVWGFDSGMMHLENILMHLVNALLVFFLSRELLRPEERDASRLPLVCALLFALNPVNVESVSWVSGRTDPMACMFIVASAVFLVRFGATHRYRFLAAAAPLIFLGVISKESAVGFLLGGVFLVCARPEAHEEIRPGRELALRILLGTVMVGAMVSLFFVLRHFAASSNLSNIGVTVSCWKTNPWYSLEVGVRALGFYLKKIFWPFPLNFAILEADPLYEFLGFPALLLLLFAAWRRTRLSALYLAGVGLIAPSFVIAFGQIAWTPFAERYAYIGSAFIITAAAHCVASLAARLDREPCRFVYRAAGDGSLPGVLPIKGTPLLRLALPLLFAAALFGTVSRAETWRSPLALATDTVRKAGDSKEIRNIYALTLFAHGDLKGAEKQLAIASSTYSLNYDARYDINYASVLRELGKHEEARHALQKAFVRTKETSTGAWEELVFLLQSQLRTAPQSEREELKQWLVASCDRFYHTRPGATKLYMLGQVALAANAREQALKYFKASLDLTPAGTQNRELAARLVAKLQQSAGT